MKYVFKVQLIVLAYSYPITELEIGLNGRRATSDHRPWWRRPFGRNFVKNKLYAWKVVDSLLCTVVHTVAWCLFKTLRILLMQYIVYLIL